MHPLEIEKATKRFGEVVAILSLRSPEKVSRRRMRRSASWRRYTADVGAKTAMEPFEFHAELFDFRSAVLEALAENGFAWLSDFGSIDLQHDVYGLEVTGIREESDARIIEGLLRDMFPKWHYRRTFYEDRNLGEVGWKVMIARDPERVDDDWKRTD